MNRDITQALTSCLVARIQLTTLESAFSLLSPDVVKAQRPMVNLAKAELTKAINLLTKLEGIDAAFHDGS